MRWVNLSPTSLKMVALPEYNNMLKYLIDFPNFITSCGLALTIIALNLIVAGHRDLAIVLLIWAVMLDHIDGWVARRIKNRNADFSKFGGELDSLTDFVSAAIAPWLILVQLKASALALLITGLLLIFSAGLRVAYFNNFGLLANGRFYGLPLTYNIPTIAFFIAAQKFCPSINLATIFPWLLSTLAIMHVLPFGPPPVRGIGFIIVFVYALIITGIMVILS